MQIFLLLKTVLVLLNEEIMFLQKKTRKTHTVVYIYRLKSSAIDELNTRLLKDASKIIIFELMYMYNSCLQHRIFPETWGLSKVTPIPKTKINSTKSEDWRQFSQISLRPTGKILEKIIHTQMYYYLEGNEILGTNSTVSGEIPVQALQFFMYLKKLYGNWNDNKFSGCLFIDFSRAFNSIDHTILAEKLKLYRFDNTSLKLMVITCPVANRPLF